MAKLKLIVRWCKRLGDLHVPQTTRNALITRFDDTNHRGDQQPPFPPYYYAPPPAVVVVVAAAATATPPVAATGPTNDPPFYDEV